MAGLLSVVNKSAYGTRAQQAALVKTVELDAQAKREELDRLLACINGENTDCLKCIRAQYCERRKRKVNVRVVIG